MAIKVNSLKKFWIVGGFVCAVSLSLYPIFIYPMLHTKEYQEAQKINRKGINREQVQPGNMRVWSDPFEPRQDLPHKTSTK